LRRHVEALFGGVIFKRYFEGGVSMEFLKQNKAAAAAIAAAAVLIIAGTMNGEPGVVFVKAIRICLECIGIG
jgi:hypothetical protein